MCAPSAPFLPSDFMASRTVRPNSFFLAASCNSDSTPVSGKIADSRLRCAAGGIPQRYRHVVGQRVEHGREAMQIVGLDAAAGG